jgi:hypothetical protein
MMRQQHPWEMGARVSRPDHRAALCAAHAHPIRFACAELVTSHATFLARRVAKRLRPQLALRLKFFVGELFKSAKLCGKTTCTKPPVCLLLTTNQPRTISLRPAVAGSRSRSGLIIAWQPREILALPDNCCECITSCPKACPRLWTVRSVSRMSEMPTIRPSAAKSVNTAALHRIYIGWW